jgi:hypothetical protein
MADANPFDQFDEPEAGNPFDQFDAPQPQPTLPTEMESIRREEMTLGIPPSNRGAVLPSQEAMVLEQERQRTLSRGATQLGEQGIKIGEAPVEARQLSGYGLSRLQGYKAALGDGYDVKVIDTEGPYKGEIIFRKKDEEGWTTVRDPSGFQSPLDVGARVRDIQSLKGTALPEFLGAVGGAAGAAAPRIPIPLLRSGALPAAAGAGFSRYYAEIARLAGIWRGCWRCPVRTHARRSHARHARPSGADG